MKLFEKQNSSKLQSTPFSDFMLNASSAQKKKVFISVLNESIEEQKKTIEKARELSRLDESFRKQKMALSTVEEYINSIKEQSIPISSLDKALKGQREVLSIAEECMNSIEEQSIPISSSDKALKDQKRVIE